MLVDNIIHCEMHSCLICLSVHQMRNFIINILTTNPNSILKRYNVINWQILFPRRALSETEMKGPEQLYSEIIHKCILYIFLNNYIFLDLLNNQLNKIIFKIKQLKLDYFINFSYLILPLKQTRGC